jgi:hypothetical protein
MANIDFVIFNTKVILSKRTYNTKKTSGAPWSFSNQILENTYAEITLTLCFQLIFAHQKFVDI